MSIYNHGWRQTHSNLHYFSIILLPLGQIGWHLQTFKYLLARAFFISIEHSKICKILKINIGPCFERFWLCSLKTQNQVFQQLVPFNTEWFKINLTLFKTHVSHKWDSIMNLFEHIYKAWYHGMMWWKWHQTWCSNTETGALLDK